MVSTSSIDLDDLGPTPFSSNVGDSDLPDDFLADTFDYPDDGPNDSEGSNHAHTVIISSIILGLGFLALVGALIFVWARRRQRTRYFREGQEVTKEGMALQSVDSFAAARKGSTVELESGAGSVAGEGLSVSKGVGGAKLEAPPPTYEEVLQAPALTSHQRASEGAVIRSGGGQSEDKDVLPDGRRLTSGSGWEHAERMEGGGEGGSEWPSVGTREFI